MSSRVTLRTASTASRSILPRLSVLNASWSRSISSSRPSLASSSSSSSSPPPGPGSPILLLQLFVGIAAGYGGRVLYERLTREVPPLDDNKAAAVPDVTKAVLVSEDGGKKDAGKLKVVEVPKAPQKAFDVPVSDEYKAMVTYIKDLQHRITSKLDSLEIEAANDPSSFPSASSATAGSSSSNSSSSTSLLSSLVPSSSSPSFSDAPTTSPTTTTIPQFIHDSWERPNQGGQGISCVLNSGRIIEKGGVNISIVHGLLPPPAIAQMRANHPSSLGSFSPSDSVPYSVCGLSLVIHPRNPNAPTVHMNVRYFELWDPKDLSKPLTFWYGGGADLTPSYLYEEDGRHFHGTLKAACDGHGEGYYPAFKEWCDKYFYLPHRQQMRGIGGIFFDDLEPTSPIHKTASPARFGGGEGEARKPRQEELFEFVKSCGDAMLPAYVPVLEKRAKMEWTEEMRRWQLLRRGLYAEYNLVQDRGTKFGLNTPGVRIESVLMSLPPLAGWEYCSDMGKEGSREGELMKAVRQARVWA